METNRHAINAHRGETFTIDKVLRNKDGTPYIISNELQNPYLLISITDVSHSQENRFFRNYWLKLNNYPRFSLTRPLSTKDIIGWTDDAVFEEMQTLDPLLFRSILDNANPGEDGDYVTSTGSMKGTWIWNDVILYDEFVLEFDKVYNVSFVSNDRIFNSIKMINFTNQSGYDSHIMYYDSTPVMYTTNSPNMLSMEWFSDVYKTIQFREISTPSLKVQINGEYYVIESNFAVIERNGEYIYWDNGWKPYECRFIKTFFSHDTKDWPAQSYKYSMQIAYGIDNREQLESLADDYGIVYSKTLPQFNDWNAPDYMSNAELYKALKELGYKFPANYDPDLPLWNISTISLLPQSDLTIVNYAQGGIY